jgi:capsid protein
MGAETSYYGCATEPETKQTTARVIPMPSADYFSYPPFRTNVRTYSYNGEVNLGEAGPIIDYRPDFVGLRMRSWQAMLESDKANIGINALVKHVIGKGLKPQAEPNETILEDEGIKLDKKKFCKSVEARFNLFMNSKSADYAGMHTGHELNRVKEKNALVGGDVLTILRYKDGKETIQLIDGEHVMSPFYGTEWYPQELPDGHRLVDGIEIDKAGRHIAFYVRTYYVSGEMKDIFAYRFDRILAYGTDSGMQMAWMYYGNEYRINNVRGMPIIAACIEKLKQMEEYSTATLNQAKEAAKVNYQVVHDKESEGETPFSNGLVSAYSIDQPINSNASLPITDDGVQMNNKVNVTGIGDAYNNPIGAKIEMLKNENPLYFKDFMQTHANDFFAVINVPPNVAMGLYTDSYSASRASVMDWLNTLIIKRDNCRVGWLQMVYNFWLEIQIYKNKIQAPGYIKARLEENREVIEAYQCIRFVGVNPPHIDPKAEAEAARVILGPALQNAPLDDVESVTERLGGGNSWENFVQAAEELEQVNKLGLKAPPIEQKVVNDNTNRNAKTKAPVKKVAKK